MGNQAGESVQARATWTVSVVLAATNDNRLLIRGNDSRGYDLPMSVLHDGDPFDEAVFISGCLGLATFKISLFDTEVNLNGDKSLYLTFLCDVHGSTLSDPDDDCRWCPIDRLPAPGLFLNKVHFEIARAVEASIAA